MRQGWKVFLVLMVLLPLGSQAQPLLNFKRITVNWPTIELYFTVSCEGVDQWTLAKSDFLIRENGEEVEDFTFWCPQPSSLPRVSTCFLMDVSGSMRGDALEEARTAAHSLLDKFWLDGDETAVFAVGRDVELLQPMTQDRDAAILSLDGLQASGATDLVAGILTALEHLAAERSHPYHGGLIIFTDGSGSITVDDRNTISAIARRHGISIHLVVVGYGFHDANLEYLCRWNGGWVWRNPGLRELAYIDASMRRQFGGGFWECVVTYQRRCAGGLPRTVEMEVHACGGYDAKTLAYREPLDSTTFPVQRMQLAALRTTPAVTLAIPLLLEQDAGGGVLRPFDVSIDAPIGSARIIGCTVPERSALRHSAANIVKTRDGVRITLREECPMGSSDTLLLLHCETAGLADTSLFFQGNVHESSASCVLTELQTGSTWIAADVRPIVFPEGPLVLCRGTSRVLHAGTGFSSYLWSNGTTGHVLTVDETGTYFVRAVTSSGDTVVSDDVQILSPSDRSFRIEAEGPLELCLGESVTLRIAGDTADCSFYWRAGGSSKRTLEATDVGVYWAEVVDSDGCRFITDSIRVLRKAPSFTWDVQTDTLWVCRADSVRLFIMDEFPVYEWSTGDSTRSIFASTDSGRTREYAVRIQDSSGCTSMWKNVWVAQHPPVKATIAPGGLILLCEGDDLELRVEGNFNSYSWSTGDSAQSITVSDAGKYFANCYSEYGCISRSDTVDVQVVEQLAPRIVTSRQNSLCMNDAVLLDAGEGYSGYRWSRGDTTRTIEVRDSGEYFVDVHSYGDCVGRSDTVRLQHEDIGYPTVTIEGPTTLCTGDTVRMHAPGGYERYYWTTGDTTRSISVAQAGTYGVTVVSSGGCEGKSLPVFVRAIDSIPPVISRSNDTLSTRSDVLSHTWFLDDVAIPGASTSVVNATKTGRYRVDVVDSCGRLLHSEEVLVTVLHVADQVFGPWVPRLPALRLYPDPVTDVLQLQLEGVRGDAEVAIHDLLGRCVFTTQLPGSGGFSVNLSALHPGFYLLRVLHRDGTLSRSLRIQ